MASESVDHTLSRVDRINVMLTRYRLTVIGLAAFVATSLALLAAAPHA